MAARFSPQLPDQLIRWMEPLALLLVSCPHVSDQFLAGNLSAFAPARPGWAS